MNKYLLTVFLIVILLSPVTTSCTGMVDPNIYGLPVAPLDGDVIALQYRSIVYGMQDALKQGTQFPRIFGRDGYLLFTWRLGQGWGFSVVDTMRGNAMRSVQDSLQGQLATCHDMRNIEDFAVNTLGWHRVLPSEVPLWLTNALSSVATFATQASTSLTTLFVFPVSNCMDINCINPEMEQ